MSEIVSLFTVFSPHLSAATLRHLCEIVFAVLAMTGGVTMRNISRWTSKGGSYRTIQRFYNTLIPWGTLCWVFFRTHLFDPESVYLLAGDESILPKSGDATYGLSRFFSSTLGKTIPGLAFFALSVISVKERRSYPMLMEQVVRGEASQTPKNAAVSTTCTSATMYAYNTYPLRPFSPLLTKGGFNYEMFLPDIPWRLRCECCAFGFDDSTERGGKLFRKGYQ